MLSVLFSKNSKVQKRGKVNLIGRLQLSTEKAKQEENDGIVALRILRIQVLNVKYMKYHIRYFTVNCICYIFLMIVVFSAFNHTNVYRSADIEGYFPRTDFLALLLGPVAWANLHVTIWRPISFSVCVGLI